MSLCVRFKYQNCKRIKWNGRK